jgi:hypothetical protein
LQCHYAGDDDAIGVVVVVEVMVLLLLMIMMMMMMMMVMIIIINMMMTLLPDSGWRCFASHLQRWSSRASIKRDSSEGY